MKKQTINEVRENNKKLIISKIIKNPGISRLELSELTGLSAASITSFTKELIKENIIEETKKRKSTGGRPKIGLNIAIKDNVNIIFEVKHRSLRYKYFINNLVKEEKVYYFDYLDGNYIVDKIEKIVKSFERKFSNIVILLEENIKENEINYLYGEYIYTENISFSSAIKMKVGEQVKIENKLKYILTEEIINLKIEKIKTYAYVSIDKNLSTFVFDSSKKQYSLNNMVSKFNLCRIFEIDNDISKWENLYNNLMNNVNNVYFSQIKNSTYYYNFITFIKKALENMLIFYELDAIFLIGNSLKFPNLDNDLFESLDFKNSLKLIQIVETDKIDTTYNLNNILLKNKILGGIE